MKNLAIVLTLVSLAVSASERRRPVLLEPADVGYGFGSAALDRAAREVRCADGESGCATGETCCLTQWGYYSCCPMPQAVCCSGGTHCCPHGYRCRASSATCVKPSSTDVLASPTVK